MADEQARKPEEESRAATGEAGQGGPQVGTRYSAQEIHENILREADDELSRPWVELAISGLASGLSIGFSYLATALLSAHVPESDRPLAAAAAYPLGFVLVVLARHQLFTENTLEPVIPLLERRTLEQLRRVLRLWG
ncbi:MAG: formate/nitrite transporter family protein, partial [Gemmatimonadales bacterium]